MNKTKTFLYAYNSKSLGARNLAESLGIKRIKHEESEFRSGHDKVIINWGCGSGVLPDEARRCGAIVNPPRFVDRCVNKLDFFRLMSENNNEVTKDKRVRIPYWTTSMEVAKSMINDGDIVVQRTEVEGKDGSGIKLAKKMVDIVRASLYTCFIPSTSEWRVHVIGGKVVDILKKVHDKDKEVREDDEKVRTTGNGFLFSRRFAEAPEDVSRQALLCHAVLSKGFDSLTMCGLDIIFDDKTGKAVVIEANSAPELLGGTVDKYVEALEEMVH